MSIDIIDEVRMTSDIQFFSYQGTNFQYYDVEDELWKQLTDKLLRRYPAWRRKFTGGMMYADQIYIKKSRTLFRKRLILHEIGHVLGYQHTWKPTIMNPTWLFRWFNRW